MENLNRDIKTGNLRQAYLLYGEEDYLKKQYRDRLVHAIVPEGGEINYKRFSGEDVNIAEVIDIAETLPFFAERRLILLEDTKLFKSGAGRQLADYILTMPETTFMVFVEDEADKRGKLYKAVAEKGYAAELKRQDERTLRRWVAGKAKAEGKDMPPGTAAYFLDKVGTDMNTISMELEKLFSYLLDKDTVSKKDVDEICCGQISNNIFAMVDAMTDGRQREALSLYYGLLAAKEPPMRILFLMARQYRYLFEIKSYVGSGMRRDEAAAKTGLHPFVAKKYMEQSKKFSESGLLSILKESAELEESVKTGKLPDTLAVELFLIKYSSGAATPLS